MSAERWYCGTCGIVRDVPGDIAPICRHNVQDVAATRMVPIGPWHPLASATLPDPRYREQ